MKLTALNGPRLWWALVASVAVAGALASFAVFMPQMWTADTIWQFEQASSGLYSDHHPPLMAAAWRLLIKVGQPLAIIPLQIALYWGAVALLLLSAPRRSLFAVVALIFPTSVALIGVIWKDAQMAVAWAAAWTLLLSSLRQPRHSLVWKSVAAVLVIYGSLIRYNAFVCAPPLLLLLITGSPFRSTALKTLAIYGVLAVASFAALVLVDTAVLKASSPRTAQMSLPIFDLAAITRDSGENAFPFAITSDEKRQVAGCFEERAWDSLYYRNSPCQWLMPRMIAYESSGHSVTRAWISAALNNPLAFIKHRARYSNQFLCVAHCFVNVNLPAYAEEDERGLTRAYLKVMWRLTYWLFAPVNALIGCLVMLAIWWRRDALEQPYIMAALLAALLNLLSYIPFGVASDQRYAYPSFVLLAFAVAAHFSVRNSTGQAE